MARITNGGPERAGKQTLGEREGRSCKHRIELKIDGQFGKVKISEILLFFKDENIRCGENKFTWKTH